MIWHRGGLLCVYAVGLPGQKFCANSRGVYVIWYHCESFLQLIFTSSLLVAYEAGGWMTWKRKELNGLDSSFYSRQSSISKALDLVCFSYLVFHRWRWTCFWRKPRSFSSFDCSCLDNSKGYGDSLIFHSPIRQFKFEAMSLRQHFDVIQTLSL